MIDAVVGAVIMVIATTSLLSAVEVIEQAFADAGRQPLSPQEKQLLNRRNRVKRVYTDGKIQYEYEKQPHSASMQLDKRDAIKNHGSRDDFSR